MYAAKIKSLSYKHLWLCHLFSREGVKTSSRCFSKSDLNSIRIITEIKLSEGACDLQRGEDISNFQIGYNPKVQFWLKHEVNLVTNTNFFLNCQ